MITKVITHISGINVEKAFLKLVATCAAGMLLNVIGIIIAKNFHLPIYLDTIGTIFIAVLGGYVPGIAVGFFTNLFGALFDSEEIYYGFVSILLAIITSFLAGKGYYEKLPKVILTIPLTVFITSFFGTFIEEMLSYSLSIDVKSDFIIHFSEELPDKALAILVSFFMLKFIPPDVKERFKLLWKMQIIIEV